MLCAMGRGVAVCKLSTGLNEVSYEYSRFEGPGLLEACFMETALSLLHFEACDAKGDFGPGLKSSACLAALWTGGTSEADGSRGWELEAACTQLLALVFSASFHRMST